MSGMNEIASGIGGVVLGWVLAQGGFIVQRRINLHGEVAKAAYFLIVLLGEIKMLISVGRVEGMHNAVDMVADRIRLCLIGKEEFHKEVAGVCEKVAAVSVGLACAIRRSCIMIDQIAKSKLTETRKLDPEFAQRVSKMYTERLIFEHDAIERIITRLLLVCDVFYFVKHCRAIGLRKAGRYLFSRGAAISMNIEDIRDVFGEAVTLVDSIAKK